MNVGNKQQIDWVERHITRKMNECGESPNITTIALMLETQFKFKMFGAREKQYKVLIKQIKKRVQKRYRERKEIARKLVTEIFERYNPKDAQALDLQQSLLEKFAYRYMMNEFFDPKKKTELRNLQTILRELRILNMFTGAEQIPVDIKVDLEKDKLSYLLKKD